MEHEKENVVNNCIDCGQLNLDLKHHCLLPYKNDWCMKKYYSKRHDKCPLSVDEIKYGK